VIFRCRGQHLRTTLGVDRTRTTAGVGMMEWTPEAIKAEVDYRQRALREMARHSRALRQNTAPKRSWWQRLTHRTEPDIPEQRNGDADAA
jgi:hypothetical protein